MCVIEYSSFKSSSFGVIMDGLGNLGLLNFLNSACERHFELKQRRQDEALIQRNKNMERVIRLMAADADMEYNDLLNDTLIIAASEGRLQVINLMLDLSADVNAKSRNHGTTALHQATLNGDAAAMQVLLMAGADRNARDNHDYTPLRSAVEANKPDLVSYLVTARVDVNVTYPDARNPEDFTSLIHASTFGYTECVKNLLDAGADMAVVNRDGRSAMDQARLHDHSDIINAIKMAAATYAIKNQPKTPISLKQFCRQRVLKSCNRHDIDQLPLPPLVIKYMYELDVTWVPRTNIHGNLYYTMPTGTPSHLC